VEKKSDYMVSGRTEGFAVLTIQITQEKGKGKMKKFYTNDKLDAIALMIMNT